MNQKKILRRPRLLAACAVLVLLFALASAAYATDVGGLRRTIQIWVHGDQTDAVLEVESGTYSLYYTDAEGNEREQHGGGVAFDAFGRERPVTEDEILEQLYAPDVEYREDGTVWVYYYGQSLEITDKFDENGVCYVQLIHDGETLYLTVKYENGCAYSSSSYVNPNSFN